MKLPYVIDNQTHRLADVLSGILAEHKGRSLDVATAYFTVGGFGLVKEGLLHLGSFRLPLGAEPSTGEQVGLRPNPLVSVSTKPPRAIGFSRRPGAQRFTKQVN